MHFYDDELKIFSNSFNLLIEDKFGKQVVEMPLPKLKKILSKFRILRRLFRIDQFTIKLIDKKNKDMIIIYNGSVYHYNGIEKKITKTMSLRQSNQLLKDSICITPDKWIYFGEYGSNKKNKPVPIYRSKDLGKSWETIFQIPSGVCRHVHGCYWDKFEEKIWILTGDFENQNHIIKTDKNFKKLKWYGDGSQKWRACNLFFTKDKIHWITDTEFQLNYHYSMCRNSEELKKLEEFPGPVWYIKHLTGSNYLAGITCENGIGSNDKYGFLYYTNDLKNWTEIERFKKDFLPKKLFKNGIISFSDGEQSIHNFTISGQGFNKFDGTSIICEIRTPLDHMINTVSLPSFKKGKNYTITSGKKLFKELCFDDFFLLFNKEFKDYTDAEIITNETILRFCEINHKNFLISLKKFDLNHNLVDLTIFLFIKNYIQSNDLRFLNISLKLIDKIPSKFYFKQINKLEFKRILKNLVGSI